MPPRVELHRHRRSILGDRNLETTYFVPLGENLEIESLELKVTNSSKRKRSIGIFTYAEFCLWDVVNDMTDFQYNLNIGQTKFSSNTIYHVTNYHAHQPSYAVWANRKVTSWTGCARR